MEQPNTRRDTKSDYLVTGMFSDRESAERAMRASLRAVTVMTL